MLNPTTGDLAITAGRLTLVSGLVAVAQRLQGRLRLGKGEWFADLSIGVPWMQAILGRKGAERLAESILRQAVATCPGVASVLEFSFVFDAATRHATVTGRVRVLGERDLAFVSGPDGFRWEAV